MESRPRLLQSLFSWLAQIVWLCGTFTANLVGFTFGAIWGLYVLGAVYSVTLLSAWFVVRWRAFAVVSLALAMQVAVCYAMGVESLCQFVGDRHWYRWSMTNMFDVRDFALTMAPTLVAAATLGPLLHSTRVVHWARTLAPRLLPVALMLATAVLGLAVYRSARYPTTERYGDSLPVMATLPGWDGSCESETTTGALWRAERHCISGRNRAGDFTFFYDCAIPVMGAQYGRCDVHVIDPSGAELLLGTSRTLKSPGVIVRDERLGVWLFHDNYGTLKRLSDSPRTTPALQLFEIRDWVAPPRSWLVAALIGWGVALLCRVAMGWLGRLVRQPTEAHRAWLATARGDLSIVALALLLVTHAFLMAALRSGFLT
ncbi:MAG: hypothetical protein U0271_08365 [Polyangiaceae bacterium]